MTKFKLLSRLVCTLQALTPQTLYKSLDAQEILSRYISTYSSYQQRVPTTLVDEYIDTELMLQFLDSNAPFPEAEYTDSSTNTEMETPDHNKAMPYDGNKGSILYITKRSIKPL